MTTTHPEYLALLAAVCDPARLADDTPRLVLADWLDENDGSSPCLRCGGTGEDLIVRTPPPIRERVGPDGRPEYYSVLEPFELFKKLPPCPTCAGAGSVPNRFAERAALIRGQCAGTIPEAAFTVHSDNERRPWWEAVGDLAAWHGRIIFPDGRRTWFDAMRDVMGPTWWAVHRTNHRVFFRRGFPAEVHLTVGLWFDLGPGLVKRFPIEVVRLTDFPPTYDPPNATWSAIVEPGGYDADGGWTHETWTFRTEEKALAAQSAGLLRLAHRANKEGNV